MIRRREGDFDWLITQHDHAAAAARLVEHFGNAKFVRPDRRESLLAAVRLHDHGWAEVELALDDSHRPLDVLDAPPQLALRAWSISADHATAADPYAGLLVSLHILALSVKAATLRPPPKNASDVAFLSEQFQVNKFLHREIERQEQLRKQLGFRIDLPLTQGLADPRTSPQEDQLAFHLRILQTTDAASLLLCGEPEDRIRGITLSPAPGVPASPVKFDYDLRGKLRMRPWPFDVKQFELQVPGRPIRRQTFGSVDDLRAAYDSSEERAMTVTIGPG